MLTLPGNRYRSRWSFKFQCKISIVTTSVSKELQMANNNNKKVVLYLHVFYYFKLQSKLQLANLMIAICQ
jgi:hypothetical protein